ncbi:MAG: hypothetical protein L0216_06440 [Planctomycetales bacterium]|nr:hypothetical protein [Planctomycetales bacterium]
MRAPFLALGLGSLVLALGPGSLFAQDAPTPETAEAARARAAADLGRHYVVAAEAKLREGEALLRAGRTEEGLGALREITKLLEKHEATVRVLGSGASAPAPAEVAPPGPATRGPAARDGGWTSAQGAVESALHWLRRHQSPDGSWSCDRFHENCRESLCGGKGSSADYTPGVTGIALLSFLGAGNTMRSGPHKDVVTRALKYLLSIQQPDGCVGPRTGDGHFFYGHAICTMALCEAYGLSGMTPALKAAAQKAVDFLVASQNPYLGWRYGVRPGDNDTSCTAWAVLALKSAKLSEMDFPAECFEGAKNWFNKVTDESFYKTGYTQKGDNGARLPESQKFQPTEAMTAAALAARIFMGAKPEEPVLKGGATLVRNMPPIWDPELSNDFYYWYYGTLAMFQMGGGYWKVWAPRLKEALVGNQRHGGDPDGSWDPCDAWGTAGGRVYSTAINTMSLEIFSRYRGPWLPKPSGDGPEGEGGK